MKIMLTSVGRRVELVQAFKDAALRCDLNLVIYGADITASAPALYFCDETVIVPRIKTPDYIPTLLDVCKKEKMSCRKYTLLQDTFIFIFFCSALIWIAYLVYLAVERCVCRVLFRLSCRSGFLLGSAAANRTNNNTTG